MSSEQNRFASLKGLSAFERSTSSEIRWGLGLLAVLLVAYLVHTGAGSQILHLPSLILVIGGTLGATLLTFSHFDIACCWYQVCRIYSTDLPSVERRMKRLLAVARRARREGFLVLEREAAREPDPFLKNALSLVADEKDPERLKAVLFAEMETEMAAMKRSARILQTMSAYAPAVGFIGTLLGLLTMLNTLGDASKVGPSMALALVATLYGTLLAHLILTPLAGRIRTWAEDEWHLKQATVEGLCGFVLDENVVLIEQRVGAFRRK